METERACGPPWKGDPLLGEGPAGPLGFLSAVDCVLSGPGKNLIPSILASKKKGKRRVLDR